MKQDKIIRTVCAFTKNPSIDDAAKIDQIIQKINSLGYTVQTKRVASTIANVDNLVDLNQKGIDYISVGDITLSQALELFPAFKNNSALTFNIELANVDITSDYVGLLYKIIAECAHKTFNFTFTFNNAPSSPYFPSARYEKDGWAIGLQPTDLAHDCSSIQEWLDKLKIVWNELADTFKDDPSFLGIDSSIAPLLSGNSSFVNFIKRIGLSFDKSVTTDIYTTITKFIKTQNPKPIGLCGMMVPALEDFELAEEYEAGRFNIERNIFLSLHSGLGIDVYPLGVDESPERVLEILKLMQALSNKYQKPLSTRFVSDGRAKIGQESYFQNQYLKDVVIRTI